MKSFKKIMAGVCSLVMLSGIATYAVSAELGDSIGSSIGTSDIVKPGDSKDPVKPGDSENPVKPGESDKPEVPGDCTGKNGITGDVTGDGNVKSNDLLLLKKYLMGFVEAKDINMANADVTGDGEVKANDLLLLKKYLLGLSEF
ncbi:MAG: dockerin type I domain-containing protein [Oscillospiraceae bacterium]